MRPKLLSVDSRFGSNQGNSETFSPESSLFPCNFFFHYFTVAALITKTPSSIVAEVGENVRLQCKATGLPIPTITWRRAFGSLPKGKTSATDGNLTIRNIAKTDKGDYVCSAKNFLGQDSVVAQLIVIDRLTFTLTPPRKVTVSQSSKLLLNCAAQGNTEIT